MSYWRNAELPYRMFSLRQVGPLVSLSWLSSKFFAADENSLDFWEDVKRQGWLHINHTQERTLERFGEWYPPLIDIVIQSMAVGFVGTEDSTFSLVSQRRVEDWNGGLVLNVNVQNGR